jgi:N-acetylneuraminic acid mutarotase
MPLTAIRSSIVTKYLFAAAALGLCLTTATRGADPAKAPAFPAMPKAVSSFGAIECDGYLYLYGGHAGKTHSYDTDSVLGTFHRLKLDGGTKWEPLPGGPIAQGMNLTSHGGKVYRVGGMQPKNKPGDPSDNHSLADCARFDPKAGKWEELPAMPAGRSSHDVVTVGDKLVVVGGWQMKGKGEKQVWPETALVMDLSEKKLAWKEIPQPFKRRALTAAAVGTKVYVLGGLGAEGADRRVDILDVATGKWSEGPDLPGSERTAFSPAACTVSGRLVVNTSAGPVYRLTEKGDGWEKVGECATKRMVARLIPFGTDRVILLGGAAGMTGNADSLEVITFGKPEKVSGER